MIKFKLKEAEYPSIGIVDHKNVAHPQELVVFILGGITFEEARFVSQINKSGQGINIILGGTKVLNSSTFLEDLKNCLGRNSNDGTANQGSIHL